MNVLDTRNVDTIIMSLSKILNVNEAKIMAYVSMNLPKYMYTNTIYDLDINPFLNYFNLSIDEIQIDKVTFHHITSRFKDEPIVKRLDPLLTFLTSNNPSILFLKEHGLRFERTGNRIETYVNNQVVNWDKYEMVGLIKNRLWGNQYVEQDICVNGFLFAEHMDISYQKLTVIPEILNQILTALNLRDLMMEYARHAKGYLYVCCLNIDEIIFDGMSDKYSKEKYVTKLLLHMLNYLIASFSKSISNVHNQCIRAFDTKTITEDEILDVIQMDMEKANIYFG